jgi:hypothetical protein
MSSWHVTGANAQAGSPNQQLSTIVLAGNISTAELKQYAMALIKIEPLRLAALERIRNQTNGNLPNLTCYQPESMNSLPRDARKVFVNYCNQSQRIAGQYGLDLNRFNEITSQVLSNPALQQRLQKQVSCIQNGSC